MHSVSGGERNVEAHGSWLSDTQVTHRKGVKACLAGCVRTEEEDENHCEQVEIIVYPSVVDHCL